jgi:hypothetical protein
MPDPRPQDLSHDELRTELERQIRLLPAEDQARRLQLIEAMQAGAAIDTDRIGELSPEELREWADHLRPPKS